MLFTDAATLLTASPGSLVYHLTLAVSLSLSLALTLEIRSRSPGVTVNRWALATAGLLMLRLGYMLIASLLWALSIDGGLILPPLDRFVSLTSVMLFAWPLILPQADRTLDQVFAAGSALALLATLVSVVLLAFLGAPVDFNATVLNLAWSLLGFTLVLAVITGLSIRRPKEWPLGLGGFSLLGLGFILHLLLSITGSTQGSLAGSVRLFELAGYPLLVIAALRAAPSTPSKPETPQRATSEAGARPSADAISEMAELTSIDSMETLAAKAVQALARVMRAEYVLLLSPPDSEGQFVIAKAYDLIRDHPLPGAALDTRRCPVIATALSRHHTLTFPLQSQAPDIDALKGILNLDNLGPALLTPMVADDQLHGGLLVLSPYARRQWSDDERAILETTAGHLAKRLDQIKRMAAQQELLASDTSTQLGEAQHRIGVLQQENTRLLQELRAITGGQGDTPSQELEAILVMHEDAQKKIRGLEKEIERLTALQSEPSQSEISMEVDRLAAELQLALRELAESRARLAATETEIDVEGLPRVAGGPDVDAIASIAQDLRQPMSSILGYTDLLLGESVGLLGAMQRKFLDRVRSGIERMGTLLNDLIQVTALETGTMSLTPGPVDLMHCVEEAITQVSGPMREKNLALRMDLPDEVPPVLGDDDAVIQILVHLLSNAISVSPEGDEVVIASRVQETEQGGFLMLALSDAGEGIPSNELARVFHHNYRADSAIIQGIGESSVALPLVKALCETLGGRVWVDSEVGVGSTFTVLLPLAEGKIRQTEVSKQAA